MSDVMTEARSMTDKDWSVLSHLAGLGAYVLPGLGGMLLTFLIWFFKKDESELVNEQGKEALNFEIAVFVYSIIAGVLCFFLVGFILLPVIIIFHVVCSIMAAMAVKSGNAYRYPCIFRIIS